LGHAAGMEASVKNLIPPTLPLEGEGGEGVMR
jgi:hypothetical protein